MAGIQGLQLARKDRDVGRLVRRLHVGRLRGRGPAASRSGQAQGAPVRRLHRHRRSREPQDLPGEDRGYRRKLREVEYGPLSDTEFLASVSSIHKADKINVPVFIAHGFNDPRVPVEEAMQLAVALKDRGQNPRVFIAPDEGHGFAKLDNRIYFYERTAAFLDETIGKTEKSSVAGARE